MTPPHAEQSDNRGFDKPPPHSWWKHPEHEGLLHFAGTSGGRHGSVLLSQRDADGNRTDAAKVRKTEWPGEWVQATDAERDAWLESVHGEEG